MGTTVRTTVVLLFLVAVLLGGMPVSAEVAAGLSISNAFFYRERQTRECERVVQRMALP